jgi:hypothetical protein
LRLPSSVSGLPSRPTCSGAANHLQSPRLDPLDLTRRRFIGSPPPPILLTRRRDPIRVHLQPELVRPLELARLNLVIQPDQLPEAGKVTWRPMSSEPGGHPRLPSLDRRRHQPLRRLRRVVLPSDNLERLPLAAFRRDRASTGGLRCGTATGHFSDPQIPVHNPSGLRMGARRDPVGRTGGLRRSSAAGRPTPAEAVRRSDSTSPRRRRASSTG